jgi:O-antigen/teichoic acid export membrane protein
LTGPEARRLHSRLPPLLAGERRRFAWSFVDQGFSSATNFALSVLAGRLLGPSGLGAVALAFSIYTIALVLQRSLLTSILLAFTSALDPADRARTARVGLTLSLVSGVTATVVVLLLGLLVSGFGRTVLLLIAPWLIVLMLQDFWRSLLFREGRGAAAAVNDGLWFVCMAAAVPLALNFKTEWAVISVWGLGALTGSAVGFLQVRLSPAPVLAAFSWWHKEGWPFARWNASAAIVVNLGGAASRFVVAGILGAGAVGGLRSVESLFAPLSAIGPALNLPGLPAVARAYRRGFRQARKMAVTISGIAIAAAVLYFAFLFLGGWHLLPLLFGQSFDRYRNLLLPVALSQIFSATGIGLGLLITVQRRGRFLLLSRVVVVTIGIAITAVGAIEYGLIGATWASAIASFILAVTVAVAAIREPRSTETGAATIDGDAMTQSSA